MCHLPTIPSALLLLVALAACGDDKKLPIGGVCQDDAACESGLCTGGMCVDPSGDEDDDGLANSLERALGTDPLRADSDGDGATDGTEIGAAQAPEDSDGDGKLDALESNVDDADGDCVVDQDDLADTDPNVPGNACVSSDCDGHLDLDEPCDDGNDITTDGCDHCAAVPTPISTPSVDAYQGAVAGLASGGFVASWDENARMPGATASRLIAFFDATGHEVLREPALDDGLGSHFFPKSATALRGGDVVLAGWMLDNSDASDFTLKTQRFTDAGVPVGDPLPIVTADAFAAEVVPTATSAYAVARFDYAELKLQIHFVDAAGTLHAPVGDLPFIANAPRLRALGFSDGSVVVAARVAGQSDPLPVALQRYGPDGVQRGSDVVITLPGVAIEDFDLIAAPDDSYRVAFVGRETGAGEAQVVGYQSVSPSDALGEVVRFDQPTDAPTGNCNRNLVASELVDGSVFVATEDRACSTPPSLFIEADGSSKRFELAPGLPGLEVAVLSAAPFAGGVAVQYVRSPLDGAIAVSYLTTFDPTGKRTVVTPAAPTR